MRTITKLLILLVLSVFVTGCPFEDKPSEQEVRKAVRYAILGKDNPNPRARVNRLMGEFGCVPADLKVEIRRTGKKIVWPVEVSVSYFCKDLSSVSKDKSGNWIIENEEKERKKVLEYRVSKDEYGDWKATKK